MIRRSTLILLTIFALLLAGAVYLQRSGKTLKAEATPTEFSPLLFSFDSQIESFRLEQVGKGVVEIGRDEQGIWELISPKAETNIGEVESAISQLLSLRVVSELKDGPGLDETGLVEPAYRLLLTLANGQQEQMNVGHLTPTKSGYYVQVGNRGIFVVGQYSLDPFLKLVENPPIQPTPSDEVEETGIPVP